jgi:hypothetical protein
MGSVAGAMKSEDTTERNEHPAEIPWPFPRLESLKNKSGIRDNFLRLEECHLTHCHRLGHP